MVRKRRDIYASSMGMSRKCNGNVKRSPRLVLKKLTRKEVAELQSGLLESCSKDLTMTTGIVPERNPTSNNLQSTLGKKSSDLIEENSECLNENPWHEEYSDDQIKNAVSSECNSSKCDQTLNISRGSPGRIDNNVAEDIHLHGKMRVNKSKPELDAPNEKYKLPSFYMTSEAKMVAKVILKKMTEEDIAKFAQKTKQPQTATEAEKLTGESRKEAPKQDVGVEEDTSMPEIDRSSSHSDSDIMDSDITRVIKKRKRGRRAYKRTPVDSDSDAILSSSDDDDYNVDKEVVKEIHKTSPYGRTNSKPERRTTRSPKQSQTATATGKLSKESRKESPEQDVGVEKATTMPKIDWSSSNSDSDITGSEIPRVTKKRKRGRGAYKRTPVDSDSAAILSSSGDDYNVEKEVVKEVHKTSPYGRTNFKPERRTTRSPKQSQTATETGKLSKERRKKAPEQDVGVEKATTMPKIDWSSSNSDSAITDSETTIKKRKRGRGAFKRTPVDSDSDAILSSSDDDDYNVEKEVVKEIHKTSLHGRTNSKPERRTTRSPKQSQIATETEKLSKESQKKAPEQDVGVEKATTMPKIDWSSSNSDSAITDSETTIKKRKRGRGAFKRTPVDSDSEAILSSSGDDDEVVKEIHKTSSYGRTNSKPERRITRSPKQSQTATKTGKLSKESRKKASEHNVGVEEDTTMPEIDRSSSNSDSDITDSVEKEVVKEIHKTSLYGRTNSKPERRITRSPKQSQTATETGKLSKESRKKAPEQDVGVEEDTTMPEIDRSSSNSDSDITDSAEKEVVKEIHKTSLYGRTNSKPERRITRSPKQSQTATETGKLSKESRKKAPEQDVDEEDITMPEIVRSSSNSDSDITDSEITRATKKRKWGRKIYKRTPVDSDSDAILSRCDYDYTVEKEIRKTSSHGRSNSKAERPTTRKLTGKMTGNSLKKAPEQDVGAEEATTMPKIDGSNSDSDFMDSEISCVTIKKRKRGRGAYVRTPVDTSSYGRTNSEAKRQTPSRRPTKKRSRLIESSGSESEEERKRNKKGKGIDKNRKEIRVHVEKFAR